MALLLAFGLSGCGVAFGQMTPTGLFDTSTFPGDAVVIDFNTIADIAPITVEYVNQGVTFSGGLFGMTNSGDTVYFPNNGGGVIASNWRYSGGFPNPTQPFYAQFAVEQMRAGFLVEMNTGDIIQLATSLGGVNHGSVSYTSVGQTAAFFGVYDPLGFDLLTVSVSGPSNHFLALDDFRFGTIPEPSVVALLGTGLLLGVAQRLLRRRSA